MISISNYCGCELGHALLVPSFILTRAAMKEVKDKLHPSKVIH